LRDVWLIVLLELLFELFCCVFAILKGGPAERAGALLIVASYITAETIIVVTSPHLPVFALFVCDFALAVGLLVVSIRYGSIWLGFAMLLQSANLCSQALSFTGDGLGQIAEATLNNVLSVLMGASIGTGALLAWRGRRRRSAKARAEMAGKPPAESTA